MPSGFTWRLLQGGANGLLRVHHAPSLPVDVHALDAARRSDEDALDLLGGQARVRFDHLRGDGGHDGSGEAGAVHVLVGAGDHVVALQLGPDELADELGLEGGGGVEVGVDSLVRLDDGP